MIQKGAATAPARIALQRLMRSNAACSIVGLRSPEQVYATRPSASRLEFARLSDGRNLITRKGQFYENEVRNVHRGPRNGHRCGDVRPRRLGWMWRAV